MRAQPAVNIHATCVLAARLQAAGR
jgi:hypothetical protein